MAALSTAGASPGCLSSGRPVVASHCCSVEASVPAATVLPSAENARARAVPSIPANCLIWVPEFASHRRGPVPGPENNTNRPSGEKVNWASLAGSTRRIRGSPEAAQPKRVREPIGVREDDDTITVEGGRAAWPQEGVATGAPGGRLPRPRAERFRNRQSPGVCHPGKMPERRLESGLNGCFDAHLQGSDGSLPVATSHR